MSTTEAELRAIANGAVGARDDGRPILRADEGDLAALGDSCWYAIGQANDPPRLFRFGGTPSRIEHDDDGSPVVRPLSAERMRWELARAADWQKQGGKSARVPKDAVADVLARPDPPLPRLMRLAEAPSFARDGSLVTEPGYHPAGQVYVWGDVPQVSVPQKPSGKDIAAARATLETELLGDFPLTGESERAHAVALLLQLFVRDLIDGPTPLYLVEKPAPGSGATLLVDAITRVATGRGLLTMTAGRDDDEMRKRISAKLYAAPPYVLFDNVRVRLDAGALAAAITATSWEDRPLGTSQTRSVPVRCAWIATGNNPQVSDEIARRTVRLRLDAKVDRPWMRRPETFRHPRLREWVDEHRRELIGAVLTLGQAWLVAGRPYDGATLGMFESWSNVIGGILQVAGVPGFLGNLDEFYEDADEEGAAWREFVAAWWEQHGDREVEVRELFTLADRLLDLGRGEEKPRHNRLGLLLREARDRQYDELRIVRAGLSRGVRRWRVVEVQA